MFPAYRPTHHRTPKNSLAALRPESAFGRRSGDYQPVPNPYLRVSARYTFFVDWHRARNTAPGDHE